MLGPGDALNEFGLPGEALLRGSSKGTCKGTLVGTLKGTLIGTLKGTPTGIGAPPKGPRTHLRVSRGCSVLGFQGSGITVLQSRIA